MPLVLGMKLGDTVTIGDDIHIRFLETSHEGIRLMFEAPKDIPILRENARVKVQVRNRNGPLVSIAVDNDGFCVCGKNTNCPMGKTGEDYRCTKEELVKEGVHVHESTVENYRDSHGGHTSVVI